MKKLLVVLIIALVSATSVFSVDEATKRAVEEKIGFGRINWELGVVIATGYGAYDLNDKNIGRGRLMALRAAEIDAKRNLLETIEGVRIDSATIVKNFQTESDVIYSRMSGFIRGARRHGDERYNSDGTVEVDVAVPLFGESGLLGILAPAIGFGDNAVPNVGSPVYSGLVVIIEDENVRPMMAPKIVAEDGTEIYSAFFVNKDFAVKMGIVGYAIDLGKAKANDRVTDNPLIVTAKKIDGDNVVISNQDAAKITSVKDQLTFIQQCRVILVLK